MPDSVRSIGIVGLGRAGTSFSAALEGLGWRVCGLAREEADRTALDSLASDVDIVLLCVPDAKVGELAGSFTGDALGAEVVLAHCSGALGLDVLGAASRRGSIHPLVSLSGDDPRQLHGAWFALSGDPALAKIVDDLDGRTVHVDDENRHLYHAAAVIASNHLVALMAQVQTVASELGLPLEVYMDLARATLDNVVRLGPEAALTGPVARGDFETVRDHIEALPESEVEAYIALARRAASLAGRDFPSAPGRADAPYRWEGASDGSRRNKKMIGRKRPGL